MERDNGPHGNLIPNLTINGHRTNSALILNLSYQR
jgi:hypothetical protein